MSTCNSTLTQEALKECLSYDPDTGIFTRLARVGIPVNRAGLPAGYTDKLGYLRIRIQGDAIYKGHRLAWLYIYGRWPNGDIDHIDGNPSNNRMSNLREATRSENRQNLLKTHSKNSHGFFGASKRSNGRWQAAITLNGVKKHLGTFATAKEASAAYIAAKRVLHPFNTI